MTPGDIIISEMPSKEGKYVRFIPPRRHLTCTVHFAVFDRKFHPLFLNMHHEKIFNRQSRISDRFVISKTKTWP